MKKIVALALCIASCAAAAPNLARFDTLARVTIENPVLQDVVNPQTGASFDGHIDFGLPVYREKRTIAVGELQQKNVAVTRSCIDGLVSKKTLVAEYGLTPEQATAFFATPMTVSIGMTGQLAFVTSIYTGYSLRLFADRR